MARAAYGNRGPVGHSRDPPPGAVCGEPWTGEGGPEGEGRVGHRRGKGGGEALGRPLPGGPSSSHQGEQQQQMVQGGQHACHGARGSADPGLDRLAGRAVAAFDRGVRVCCGLPRPASRHMYLAPCAEVHAHNHHSHAQVNSTFCLLHPPTPFASSHNTAMADDVPAAAPAPAKKAAAKKVGANAPVLVGCAACCLLHQGTRACCASSRGSGSLALGARVLRVSFKALKGSALLPPHGPHPAQRPHASERWQGPTTPDVD